jgi:hypothetical protein
MKTMKILYMNDIAMLAATFAGGSVGLVLRSIYNGVPLNYRDFVNLGFYGAVGFYLGKGLVYGHETYIKSTKH